MLVSLGFLLAILLGFIVAPAYWARAVRLTTERIRRSLPMTIAEIQASQDRLRAENAIRVHRLESRFDRARLSAARQRVESNRRDAVISSLERRAKELTTTLEASENACRVFKQTIMDRVPKIERRLVDARRLISQRDNDMAKLKADTANTFRALDEAMQINAQQRSEIDRLQSALATRGARSREGASNPKFDSEVALRSEVEALRARTRDQASLIARLQEIVSAGVPASVVSATENDEARTADESNKGSKQELPQGPPEASNVASTASDPASQIGDKLDLVSAELKSVQFSGEEDLVRISAEAKALKSANRVQLDEIEALQAALAKRDNATEEGVMPISLRDSKIALRSRLASSEKEVLSQAEVIQRLRAELAGSNDRQARQAAHFMDEMRRLGAGTMPTSARSRRHDSIDWPAPASPHQAEAYQSDDVDIPVAKRPSLAQRISERVPETAPELARGQDAPGLVDSLSKSIAPSKATEVLVENDKAPPETVPQPPPEALSLIAKAGSLAQDPDPNDRGPNGRGDEHDADRSSNGSDMDSSVKDNEPDTADDKPRRPRTGLMDRIASLGKS